MCRKLMDAYYGTSSILHEIMKVIYRCFSPEFSDSVRRLAMKIDATLNFQVFSLYSCSPLMCTMLTSIVNVNHVPTPYYTNRTKFTTFDSRGRVRREGVMDVCALCLNQCSFDKGTTLLSTHPYTSGIRFLLEIGFPMHRVLIFHFSTNTETRFDEFFFGETIRRSKNLSDKNPIHMHFHTQTHTQPHGSHPKSIQMQMKSAKNFC